MRACLPRMQREQSRGALEKERERERERERCFGSSFYMFFLPLGLSFVN